jgi:hypothetical protein
MPHAMPHASIPYTISRRRGSLLRESAEFFMAKAFVTRKTEGTPAFIEQPIEQFLQSEKFPEHEGPHSNS